MIPEDFYYRSLNKPSNIRRHSQIANDTFTPNANSASGVRFTFKIYVDTGRAASGGAAVGQAQSEWRGIDLATSVANAGVGKLNFCVSKCRVNKSERFVV